MQIIGFYAIIRKGRKGVMCTTQSVGKRKMRKILLCISILGLIGYLLFEFLLKNKVPGNFKIPLYLFILGLIYAPYIIGCFLDKKNGQTDKHEPKSFGDFRFLIGLFTYIIILILYIIIFITKTIL